MAIAYVSGGISKLSKEEGEKRFNVGVALAMAIMGVCVDDVVNPIEKEIKGTWTQEQWMEHWHGVIFKGDIECMIMCEGWKDSAGACQERRWAQELGLKVIYA